MPAKKGSIDKNLVEKTLDGARYIGKNFWKILPVGSAINYQEKRDKGLIDKNNPNGILHGMYALAGVGFLFSYILFETTTGAWTPKQIKAYNEKVRIEQQIETEHKKEVEYKYDKIFEDTKTRNFWDSLEIYKKYNLPFKFVEPTLEQKEKVIKQSNLEKGLN
jgi:hypothetical protein